MSTLQALPPDARVRSGHEVVKTYIIFTNHLDKPVRLCRIDHDGEEIEVAVIKSRGKSTQHTYVNSAWRVKTFDKCLPICAFIVEKKHAAAPIRVYKQA